MSDQPSVDLAPIDPTVVYASRNGIIPPKLFAIFTMDTRVCSQEEAADAFETVKSFAQNGSPFAMCMCSRFSQSGWGTVKSGDNAFSWANKASASGFAPGHYELGICYEAGIGVDRNIDEALRCWVLASDAGFGFAALHLAIIHHSGKLGFPDHALALKWAMRAYELDEPMAPLELARWFEEGEGVARDESVALMWYERASKLGNFLASSRLCLAYGFGDLGLGKDNELAAKYQALSLAQTQALPSRA